MSPVARVKLISYNGLASDIDDFMYALDKIDPQFRLITDQLFFSDRTDLDLSNYLNLLGNKDDHYFYLWDRFIRGSDIFWDESFWINRFELLSVWSPRTLVKDIEVHLMNHFKRLINTAWAADPKIHTIYIQIIAWAKVRAARKDNVLPLKELLLELPNTTQIPKVIGVVNKFIPFLFSSQDEYVDALTKKVGQSARSFDVLRELERQGITINKDPMFKFCKDLLSKRVPNRKNRRSFFTMIEDPSIMSTLKKEYLPEYRARLISLIKSCDFREIEEHHLRNIKNLLELDSTIADELLTTYANSLYSRRTSHKKANVTRLIRACKTFSSLSSKRLLAYLSINNKMSDIKYVLSAFPDLQKLAPFI